MTSEVPNTFLHEDYINVLHRDHISVQQLM